MSLREGQENGRFRGRAKFDLSAATELTLVFDRVGPGATKLVVKTADGVTAPSVAVDDPKLGPLNADEYFEYFFAPGEIPAGSKGTWPVCGIYEDNTTTPTTKTPSLHGSIEILEGCVE